MTGADILSVAEKEVGYHEAAGKHTKYGAWYGLQCYPWCMEFVQWCYAQSGAPLPFKTASCGALLTWYERNAPRCITSKPKKGCIVIFGWKNSKEHTSHTGLFVDADATKITTIDGNTKNKGGGSDDNGGWVNRRTRSFAAIRNIWYIVPDAISEELDMTKAEFLASLTPAEAEQIVALAQTALRKRSASEWAAGVCKKAVASGVFADGNGDGTLDAPRAFVTREELAQTYTNAGIIK